MAFWNTQTTLANAITDWQARGIVDGETADILRKDAQARKRNIPFRNILILLAVICLGFAAMTFVAANWDDMPRIQRVGLIFSAMWIFWGLSAVFRWHGQNWFPQVFTLGACAMFGAAIMLISQLYHVQGSAKDDTWLWAMGTILAACLTRSTPALALSIILLNLWTFLEPNIFSWRAPHYQFDFLIYIGVCAALALWMRSRFSAHLIVISTLIWAIPSALRLLEDEHSATFTMILIGLSFIIISLALLSDRWENILNGFERPLLFYTFVLLGIPLSAWGSHPDITWHNIYSEGVYLQIILPASLAMVGTLIIAVLSFRQQHPNAYDIVINLIFTVVTFTFMVFGGGYDVLLFALLLSGAIWMIRMGWRLEFRPLTILGFLAFGIVMIWIYAETIGSLFATSLFYGGVGALLLAGIFIIPRIVKPKPEGDIQ